MTFNTNFVDFYSEYNKNMELEGYKNYILMGYIQLRKVIE